VVKGVGGKFKKAKEGEVDKKETGREKSQKAEIADTN